MKELKAKTESEARAEVLELSKSDPSGYYIVSAVFGLFAERSKRLHVHAPSDTPFEWYAHGGKIRYFSESQRATDWDATPMMA